ncbi:hypothetical protein [Halovivax cerinus]|uniref:Uncharacterized protein n=1 Tax=Halovivax cerinus TaxID=1487865 RepID=A0ABD5NTX0_9EURY|nr:hypothetical protein [Halovivax cerinus]
MDAGEPVLADIGLEYEDEAGVGRDPAELEAILESLAVARDDLKREGTHGRT